MQPRMWRGVIEEYREFLPVTDATPVITLREGGTPLLESRLGTPHGLRLLVKYEATNPTGSFKDRGMTVAVSKAVEARARGIICASTGNTAASAAAYAARAGLPCALIVPASGVALGNWSRGLPAERPSSPSRPPLIARWIWCARQRRSLDSHWSTPSIPTGFFYSRRRHTRSATRWAGRH